IWTIVPGLTKGLKMRYLRYLALLGIFMLNASYSKAQVSVGIGVGPGYGYVGAAPVCSYGYYDYYPYECAPYGFYGPDYFVGGVFIGAGPWYRGYYGRGGYGYYGRGRGYARGYNNDRYYGRANGYNGRDYGFSGRRSNGNYGRSNGYSGHNNGYSGRGNGYSGHGGGESRGSGGGGYHGGHGGEGSHGNGGGGSRGGGHRYFAPNYSTEKTNG